MSAVQRFQSFRKSRETAVESLGEFIVNVEPIEHSDGAKGYRLKPMSNGEKITHRCKFLIQETWHCRDYLKKILVESGKSHAEAGRTVNQYIEKSLSIQVISYLANEHKHAGIDEDRQSWGLELEPRLGRPFVLGQLLSFPNRMKPTIIRWGENVPELEFVGQAGVGEQAFPFEGFEWTFSCEVLFKGAKGIQHAAGLCNDAYKTWLKVLNDNDIQV
jgi:hypothetical protein